MITINFFHDEAGDMPDLEREIIPVLFTFIPPIVYGMKH